MNEQKRKKEKRTNLRRKEGKYERKKEKIVYTKERKKEHK